MKTCLLAVLSFLLLGQCLQAQEKPNVVLIFIDDMGYGDIGPFGSKVNQTPNLDQMAREGNVIRQFYVANTLCTPSRAALMTGTYAHRIGMDGSVNFPGENKGLNPSEMTIAEMFKENGYATGCFGKWHLGDQPEFLPLSQGFDCYFGIPYSNDMWSLSKNGNPVTHGGPQPPLPVISQDEVVAYVSDGADQSLLCEVVTDHAVKFIEDHQDEPFFCYVPHVFIHLPRYVRAENQERADGNVTRATIEEVDTSVGRILETLKKLKLDEKTLVVFTSDNGPAEGASAGNLRGRKMSPKYEGHMRVPTLTWWPGKIPAGVTTEAIGTTIDLYPTFAHLTGGKVPTDPAIDGQDISEILLGNPDAKSPHEILYYENEGIRRGNWKLVRANNKSELYDLSSDESEKHDVSKKHPELVKELNGLLDAHAQEIAAHTRPAGFIDRKDAKPLITTIGEIPRLRDYAGMPDVSVIAPNQAAK